jgi:hypothetical protein
MTVRLANELRMSCRGRRPLSQAGRLFSAVHVAAVPILLEQTADELNALLRTVSSYQRLSLEQRRVLESEHIDMYERLGRPIRSSAVAVLVTARRTTDI